MDDIDPDDILNDSDEDDPLVLFCNTPNCVMPGMHCISECHTPEMIEGQQTDE